METGNDQIVGVRGDLIIVLHPKQQMTKAEALRHAAWLVALADEDDGFAAILNAVRET